MAPPPGSFPGAVVELEGPRGRMRIELKGVAREELVARSLAAHQLQVLLAAGDPTATQAAPAWRPLSALG